MRVFRRFFCASTSACFTSALSSVCCCLLDFFAKTDSSWTRPEKPSILSEFRPGFSSRVARPGRGQLGLQAGVLLALGGRGGALLHQREQLLLAPPQPRLAEALDDPVDLRSLIKI